ncbi:MAG: GTPase HflX [Eggerthellaceae bacterium]|nr:GTPase HflX [Eggerthellaceae bacterium]
MSARFPLRSTEPVPERAILVGIERPGSRFSLDETLAELGRLAHTAGAQVVAQTTQRLEAPNPKTFVGSGKLEEIAQMCRTLSADLVVFDDELTPSQQSNLEKSVGKDVKVIDRTALILDIFALHATTREGRLQIRLAQNQYLYPRLRGMWAHLASNRMGGGVGSRFGEGESQLEVDRRIVRNRITQIKRELADLARNRNVQRASRNTSGIVRVSLAGYTNAGKSSLLNALCGSDVLEQDQLFATLDSTTRRLTLEGGRTVTLTDTVGFIQKLPTTLIESFKSTLDEIRESDIVLHVVDATSDSYEAQMEAVEEVLGQIGAQGIVRILVFNKIDLVDEETRAALRGRWPLALLVSARTREGTGDLAKRIAALAAAQEEMLSLIVPYDQGSIVSLAHERCSIVEERHEEDGTHLVVRAPAALVPHFASYVEQG